MVGAVTVPPSHAPRTSAEKVLVASGLCGRGASQRGHFDPTCPVAKVASRGSTRDPHRRTVTVTSSPSWALQSLAATASHGAPGLLAANRQTKLHFNPTEALTQKPQL